jgi:hypothetical protein
MADERMDEGAEADLVLPRSGLMLVDGDLLKVTRGGEAQGRIPLREVAEIRLGFALEPLGFILGGAGVGIALICKLFIDSEFWSWLLAVLFSAVAAGCFMLVRKTRLIVVSSLGEVKYDIADMLDEATGFVLSIRHHQKSLAEGEKDVVADRARREARANHGDRS